MTTCARCGNALEPAVRGRPRRYCSRACQAKAYRARTAGEPAIDPTAPGAEATPATAGENDPPHLTVERIVRAGIAIADAEGLDALSMRAVASRLDAGTMSLYRHVTSRDELVALMVEAALTEAPPAQPPPRDWREGLERAAHRDWELYRRHPWILSNVMMSTRLRPSPGMAADNEYTFTSLDGLDLEPGEAFRYVFTVTAYTQGVAVTLVDEIRNERRSGPASRRRRTSADPSWDALYATGAYPRLTRAMRAAGEPWDLDALFRSGLTDVLDGIAASLARRET
ncbi:TetR/AcrR family transcriptional regulator [Embleya sp. MST-111070]|uniref:TetR/AcrR family transcriptional regulator n=1 Tax=Embleya sp. MST-111070 TaxID=3398231 RepID=UPI003F7365FF